MDNTNAHNAPTIRFEHGARLYPGFLSRDIQASLAADVRTAIADAPLFRPTMPKTGKPLSVRMSNLGPLGWVTDKEGGYRYQTVHPVTGAPWPAIPETLLNVWHRVTGLDAPPEACLVNIYEAGAKMGLHQDRDEQDLSFPVVSVSLGNDARFRLGGTTRSAPTSSFRLSSGDVLVLAGEDRLAFHGIDRVYPGTSKMLDGDVRLNLTLRRVTALPADKALRTWEEGQER